jgi:NitT/TauT family transport system substrate-binding protein
VHEDLIKSNPDVVRDLVRGIAQSGKWAETHRAEAAKIVAPYFRQNVRLLNYVLTSEPHRVKYVDLSPSFADLQQIQDLGIQLGMLTKHIPMSQLVDDSFVPDHIEAAHIHAPGN